MAPKGPENSLIRKCYNLTFKIDTHWNRSLVAGKIVNWNVITVFAWAKLAFKHPLEALGGFLF